MAMADKHEDGELDFKQGMPWLPSHELDEACDAKVANRRSRHRKPRSLPHTPKSPVEPASPVNAHYKPGSRSYHRSKFSSSRASGGPGMQAIFLDSSQRSGGTGVFIPQPSRRAACAPVLVPARVVQALKLDVHALGVQISPRQEPRSRKCPNCRSMKIPDQNESDGELTSQSCVSSQIERCTPELFLPKEWTY